jgi:mannan polymerase II complex ANP1 subunit
MRKLLSNGSYSPFSSRSNSRSPSPPSGVQILPPHHRFQPRSQKSKRVEISRGTIRCMVLAVVLLLLFVIMRHPNFAKRRIIATQVEDDSFLLGEDIPSVRFYDLSVATGTSRGWERNERVLICVPLRDASPILPLFFSHMRNLSYPHQLIDLAFLVSDSTDSTLQTLLHHLTLLQQSPLRFNQALVFEKDFGQGVGQGFSDRHGFMAQGPRRKVMARARNWLISNALTPAYSWVYWRDADVETAPATIIEVTFLRTTLTLGSHAT